MRGSRSSLGTKIWRATFSEFLLQALPAQAVAAGRRLQRGQLGAPAAAIGRTALKSPPAPGAGQVPQRQSLPGS